MPDDAKDKAGAGNPAVEEAMEQLALGRTLGTSSVVDEDAAFDEHLRQTHGWNTAFDAESGAASVPEDMLVQSFRRAMLGNEQMPADEVERHMALFCADVGRELRGENRHDGQPLTRAQALARITKIMHDRDHPLRKDGPDRDFWMSEWTRLHKIAYD